MPLISLIRLLWPCAVGLERVSIKMHRNCLSETPITITSADVSVFFFLFFYMSSVSTAHIGRSLSYPALVPLHIRSTTDIGYLRSWVAESGANGRKRQPSEANGRGCGPCYQGWLKEQSVCVWERAHDAATHQWPAIIIHYGLIGLIINVDPIKTLDEHICVSAVRWSVSVTLDPLI